MKKQPEATAATRKKLIDSFWELYKEKSIDKISVGEITALSGNNRSTFYHYFKDVYELLEQSEEEILADANTEISQYLSDIKEISSEEQTLQMLRLFALPIFNRYEEKIFILLGPHGDPMFRTKLQNNMYNNLQKNAILPTKNIYTDYMISFAISSIIGLLSLWHQREKDLDDEEFIKIAQTLIAKGILGFNIFPEYKISLNKPST